MNLAIKSLCKILISILIFSSCSGEKKSKIDKKIKVKLKSEIKYANSFDIQYFKNYKKLIIKSPYPNSKETFEYVLIDQKSNYIAAKNQIALRVPIHKIVVTSTTHIPMLELLNEENTLVGFPSVNYISSAKTSKLVSKNLVKELGIKGDLNTESVLELQPDVVVGYSMTSANKTLQTIEKAGIPVLLNGDWLEETPLGRAEWIKFFGALYNKEKEADSIFDVIEKNYLNAKKLAQKATERPTILSGAVMSKSIWNLPAGDSFVAQLLRDANSNYLWKDSKGKGSLSISFESVFDKAIQADFWIAPGYFTSKKQLLISNKLYQNFAAFKNNSIYTFANTVGTSGGVIYFELGPTRPDLVLKDIIKIIHPSLLPTYQFTFFEKMQ